MNNQKMNSTKETKWLITANRFVVYIDIMGFKDMVSKISHQKIYDMMKKIEKQKFFYTNISWGGKSSQLVKSTTYSDSIMLYSKTGSYDSLRALLSSTAALIDTLFVENIPHKGALAFGKMTLDPDNSIYFGQPLIDAYLLQKEIHFYGIVVHCTVENKIDKTRKRKTLPHINSYLCPFKNGKSEHLTISPLYTTLGNSSQFKEKSKRLFDSVKNLRYNTSGHLRQYIDNTELYLNSLK